MCIASRCIILLTDGTQTSSRWYTVFNWWGTSQFGHTGKSYLQSIMHSLIMSGTAKHKGWVWTMYICWKVEPCMLRTVISHDLGWSCFIFLFTIFSMSKGCRQCSEGSYWVSWSIWTVLSKNGHHYKRLYLQNVRWHFLLISWIGHYGDHMVQNKHHGCVQAVKLPKIMFYLKCFGWDLARWCFQPWSVYWPKVALKAHVLGNSIHSNIDQNTPNKAQWGVLTLSELNHSVYFASNGLLGTLFIE
jgi:hypothetical protein